MQPGYGIQLDRTCYNIAYTTPSSPVAEGTYLFSIVIFIEEGTTGTIAGFRDTHIIAFSGPGASGSAFSIVLPLNPPSNNATYEINAGLTVGESEELTYGSYSTVIRVTLVVPFSAVTYPVNIQIIGKLVLLFS